MNEQIREQFPTLKKQNYLASCSQGLLSKNASNSINYYHNELLEYGGNWGHALKVVEKSRAAFANLIGAEPSEIAIVSSVSHAIAAIATSIQPSVRDEVVFTDMDFPTVHHIWSSQHEFKGKYQIVQSENGEIPLELFEEKISSKTIITLIPHVHYLSGYEFDLKEISDIAHRKGSFLFVDAYQSAGHCSINVKEMGIDFLATGTRKYLLGIPGIAFLYINKEVLNELHPKFTGWLGQGAEGAIEFDSGTPSFISAYVANEALAFIGGIGVERISSYMDGLGEFAINYGKEKGLMLFGTDQLNNRSSLTSFIKDNAQQIAIRLKEKNIIVSAKDNIIRIAPHFYTTKQDIASAIKEISFFN